MSPDEDDVQPLLPLDLLGALNRHDVEFVVIGGFALSAHDAIRATKDIDIVPDPSPANLDRLWAALVDLDAAPFTIADFDPIEHPLEWERASFGFGGNWLLATRLGRLDILQYVSGVDGFDQLRQNAVPTLTDISGRIWMAGRDDLIAMKRAAGRPQDLVDIERLERRASRDE
ncbi:MAG: hypothetical protein JWM25_531 [Thermoleophilia bacterium]|nr:hypothetical protein [Thermoleophilia bacterium]MCZ4495948.1 hypothetical protein [Thermoleophilia bacterium]